MHPEFVKTLPSYNIFTCSGDPDSSQILSQPVVPTFYYSFTYNVACVENYRRWGCRNVDWLFTPENKLFVENASS